MTGPTSLQAPSLPMGDSCPMCGAPTGEVFFEFADVPVFCNVLWPDVDAARTATCGDIELTCCSSCGLIFNRAFSPAAVEYAPGYENALHFSETFREFAEEMADHLVNTYKLQGKVAAEIGCGDAYFLRLLCRRGVRQGIGFDPSVHDKTAVSSAGPNIEIVPNLFDAKRLPPQVDAVLCRHVLEHIAEPVDFLMDVRHALGDRDALLYFEVPNAQWMLEARSLWDVIYEHCTYWTPLTLTALFRRCGFEPLAVRSGFGGQYLMIEARPAPLQSGASDPNPGDLDRLSELSRQFGQDSSNKLKAWGERLAELANRGESAAVWGAGSKGITFMNAVGGAGQAVCCVVDVNPRKHGQYVARRCLPVVAPEDLGALRPDMVLIMNELYEAEIRQKLLDMGVTAEIGCV